MSNLCFSLPRFLEEDNLSPVWKTTFEFDAHGHLRGLAYPAYGGVPLSSQDVTRAWNIDPSIKEEIRKGSLKNGSYYVV